MVAWKAVSKAATWGSAGQASATASMPASAAGLCSGASAASSAIAVRTPASTTPASRKVAPPWTTRCPTASTAGSRRSTARTSAACRPGSCSAHDSVPCTATASVATSSTDHLSELEPALSTSTRVMCPSGSLLDRGIPGSLLDRGLRGHPGQVDARSASCAPPVYCWTQGTALGPADAAEPRHVHVQSRIWGAPSRCSCEDASAFWISDSSSTMSPGACGLMLLLGLQIGSNVERRVRDHQRLGVDVGRQVTNEDVAQPTAGAKPGLLVQRRTHQIIRYDCDPSGGRLPLAIAHQPDRHVCGLSVVGNRDDTRVVEVLVQGFGDGMDANSRFRQGSARLAPPDVPTWQIGGMALPQACPRRTYRCPHYRTVLVAIG